MRAFVVLTLAYFTYFFCLVLFYYFVVVVFEIGSHVSSAGIKDAT